MKNKEENGLVKLWRNQGGRSGEQGVHMLDEREEEVNGDP